MISKQNYKYLIVKYILQKTAESAQAKISKKDLGKIETKTSTSTTSITTRVATSFLNGVLICMVFCSYYCGWGHSHCCFNYYLLLLLCLLRRVLPQKKNCG